jgi:RecA-family ATPase
VTEEILFPYREEIFERIPSSGDAHHKNGKLAPDQAASLVRDAVQEILQAPTQKILGVFSGIVCRLRDAGVPASAAVGPLQGVADQRQMVSLGYGSHVRTQLLEFERRAPDDKTDHDMGPDEGVFENGPLSGVPISEERPGRGQPSQIVPLHTINVADWEGKPVEEIHWVIKDILPAEELTIFNGHGGASKTQFVSQLAVAVGLHTDVCGFPIYNGGPVLFFSAEETSKRLHRRFHSILNRVGRSFRELNGQLEIFSTRDPDSIRRFPNPLLAKVERDGVVKPTPLFRSLAHKAEGMQPAVIVIENARNVFSGDEKDPSEVTQFCDLLIRLAISLRCATILLQHVSIIGKSSGEMTSGTLAWHNCCRSRWSMSLPRNEKTKEEDNNFRIFQFHKAQYGQREATRILRNDHGYLIPEVVQEGDKAIKSAQAAETFLALLDECAAQGRYFSGTPCGTYAPARFAELPDVTFSAKELEDAMNRLMRVNKIRVGPKPNVSPSKAGAVILRCSGVGSDSPSDPQTRCQSMGSDPPSDPKVQQNQGEYS